MKNKKESDNRNGNDLANTSVLTKYTSTLWVYQFSNRIFYSYYGIEAYVGSSMESEKDDGCVFPICYDENYS